MLIAVPEENEVRVPRKTNMDASVMERLAVKVVPGIFADQRIEFLQNTADLSAMIAKVESQSGV